MSCERETDNKYDEYRVREALRIITEAEKIKKDSKMMGLVAKELKSQEKALLATKLSVDDMLKMSDKELSNKLK